jgi:nuclear GTP-binding protein
LLKGGEPDLNTVAKMILNDWIRGKIPFYTLPNGSNRDENDASESSPQKENQTEVEVEVCFF